MNNALKQKYDVIDSYCNWLHINDENFITNTNQQGSLDIVGWIDNFVEKYCTDEWREFLLLKWNKGNASLQNVAEKVGLTRERIRQIIRIKISNI